MSDHDVAIIGAGAAGLAAGKACQARGLSFVVLEAKDRVGGRAHTDSTTFNTPWDRGGHWLHSASVNPLTMLADELGIAYLKRVSFNNRHLHLGTGWADEATRALSNAGTDADFARSEALGAAGKDVAVLEAFDTGGRWYRLTDHLTEAISAMPPKDVSALDYYRYGDTEENWPVVKGYGALVEACGAGVPVSLETPVSEVDWSGAGVTLTTPKGTVKARAAIITVSTNVLASGRIKFTRGLPLELQRALEMVPTGLANKVAVQFSRDVFGLPDTSYAYLMDERDAQRRAMSLQIRPFGQELAIAYLGGTHAVDMERAGDEEAFTETRAALSDMFGSDILRHVVKMEATHWGADPHTMGAYSCARPGGANLRDVLRLPIENKVFLAGEATHASWYSTVHGAWESGFHAVERVAQSLG
ncbi:MAG: flavin monoamine oxidase family protein [Parvibaculaceae bacterium]